MNSLNNIAQTTTSGCAIPQGSWQLPNKLEDVSVYDKLRAIVDLSASIKDLRVPAPRAAEELELVLIKLVKSI